MDTEDAYNVLDLKALRCFWAVAKHGSLTRAGIELGISESAIAQRVKALEGYLGTKLYESPGGRARLTPAGQLTMERAVALFERIDDFQRELTGQEAMGSLTVSTEDSVARYLLPAIVQRFTREHPHVRLRIITRPVVEMVHLVRQGDVDMAIIPQCPLPESMVFHPWRTYEAYLLVPRDHPLVRGRKPTIRELLNRSTITRYPLIMPERADPAYARVGEALATQGLPYNVAFEIGTRETVKHYVALGLGITVASGICLTEEDKERLEAIEIPKQYGGTITYGIVLRRDKYFATPLKGFMSLMGVSRS